MSAPTFDRLEDLHAYNARQRADATRRLTAAAVELLESAIALQRLGRTEAAAHIDGLSTGMLELAGELSRESFEELLGPQIQADRNAQLRAGLVPPQPRPWPPPRKADR